MVQMQTYLKVADNTGAKELMGGRKVRATQSAVLPNGKISARE